jgi:hypothetical protein
MQNNIVNVMQNLQINLKRARIKLFSWEYWPMWIVYLPASFYYVYLAIKARSLFFFSASNPSIENGGMLFESKWKIFNLIPKELYPNTIYIDEFESIESIAKKLTVEKLKFPVIAKPDVGGRGFGVKKIYTQNDLENYRNLVNVPFLIQECIDYPLEVSVFYYRNPNENKGQITSVTVKELLTITGDGKSKIETLIKNNDRAFLQYEKLKSDPTLDVNKILEKGEIRTLVPYGNHVLGAMFLDYNHIIDNDLINTFDSISKRVEGFYFGRYDIKCTSIEDLKKGKNISILELNGSGAEPAHIYDPSFSFLKAQKVLTNYFKNMYTASIENHKTGTRYMTYNEFKLTRNLEKAYKQKITV